MKEFLSVTDVCEYLSVSKSFVYKLSSANVLPKHCPMGKLVYFKRSDIDSWLEKSRISSESELTSEIDFKDYKIKNKR